MKFLDLHERVEKNQKIAMQDQRIHKLDKKAKERFLQNRRAEERAYEHKKSMSALVIRKRAEIEAKN